MNLNDDATCRFCMKEVQNMHHRHHMCLGSSTEAYEHCQWWISSPRCLAALISKSHYRIHTGGIWSSTTVLLPRIEMSDNPIKIVIVLPKNVENYSYFIHSKNCVPQSTVRRQIFLSHIMDFYKSGIYYFSSEMTDMDLTEWWERLVSRELSDAEHKYRVHKSTLQQP